MKIKTFAFFIIFLLAGYVLQTGTCYPGEKPVAYFGIGLRYDPITMYERFQPLMDYLTQNTPYKFELKINRDYKSTSKSLAEGATDVSAIGDGGLMKAMLKYGAVPIVKPLSADGRPFYHCYFIVPANSPLHSLADLKGKRVAFGSRHSTTGNLIPRHMLQKSGIKIKDLRSLTNLKNHNAVAMAVMKGEYDAGALKDTVAKQYDNRNFRVLASSDDLPSVPLIVRKDAPQELVKAVTEALTKLNRRNPEHRKLMDRLDVEYRYGFAPATAADYRELTRLFKAVPYGCATGCHR